MCSTVIKNLHHRKAPFWLNLGLQVSPMPKLQSVVSKFITVIAVSSVPYVSALPTRNVFLAAACWQSFQTISAWTAVKVFTNHQNKVFVCFVQFNARAVPLLMDKSNVVLATQISHPLLIPPSLLWDAEPTIQRQLKQLIKTLRTVLGCLLKLQEIVSLNVDIILLLVVSLSVSQDPHSRESSLSYPHIPQYTSISLCS